MLLRLRREGPDRREAGQPTLLHRPSAARRRSGRSPAPGTSAASTPSRRHTSSASSASSTAGCSGALDSPGYRVPARSDDRLAVRDEDELDRQVQKRAQLLRSCALVMPLGQVAQHSRPPPQAGTQLVILTGLKLPLANLLRATRRSRTSGEVDKGGGMRKLRIAVPIAAVIVAAGLAIGTALGHGKPRSTEKTWTTVYKSPISIEGLTLDEEGNLYVPQRGGAAGCSIVRIDAEGGAGPAGGHGGADEPAVQSGGPGVRSRRPAVPDRLRRGRGRDRGRASERRRSGEPARGDGLRDGRARRERRRVRRGRQPLRLGRRHRAGPRLPRRAFRRRGDGAVPRPADGERGRRRPPEPGGPAQRPARDAGHRRERARLRQARRPVRGGHGSRCAVEGRAEQARASYARRRGAT